MISEGLLHTDSVANFPLHQTDCRVNFFLFQMDDDEDDDDDDDEQDSVPSAAGSVENGFGVPRRRKSGSNPWRRTGITHHEYHSYIDSTLECRRQSVN